MKTKEEVLRKVLGEKGVLGLFVEGSSVWKAVLESMEEYAQQFVSVSSDNPCVTEMPVSFSEWRKSSYKVFDKGDIDKYRINPLDGVHYV